MTRYVRQFFNRSPMVELNETEALESGDYCKEFVDPMLHYRCFIDHELHKIVYPGWGNPEIPLAEFRCRKVGVRGEIYSPVEQRTDGSARWQTWYVHSNGEIEKILESEFDGEGRYVRELYRGPDGRLRSYHVYHYDNAGEVLEVITHAPDGTVINRQHS